MSNPRSLAQEIFRYPLTWVAGAVIGLFEWGFLTWFQPGWLVALGVALVGVASGLGWVGLLTKSSAFRARLLQRAVDSARRRITEVDTERLRGELDDVGSEQGVAQLQMLTQKRDALIQVLRHRLSAGELTFTRYMGAAEQVYLSTLDNLHDVAVTMTSIKGMDRDYIDQRLATMDVPASTQTRTGSAHKERDTLEQRRALLDSQLERVAALFAQNEAAMTGLDNTAAALAQTRMASGEAAMSADQAMLALEDLASRTARFAVGDS
jgi:hypothetical protein